MPARRALRSYPVGIAVQPPPGWVPPLPAARRPSTFRAQVGLVLRAMLLSSLVLVCMGIGWFLVNGRRPARGTMPQASAEVPKKADKGVSPPPVETEEKRPPARRELTYEKDVLPIVDRACLNCHGARKRSGGLDLRTYAALVKGGDGGTGVVPGEPAKSPLYETVASGQMPPGGKKLSANEREIIRAWIAAGAKAGG